jgi:magnesium chelatase subunit D
VSTPGFPFSAVVGHDDLRLALLLNAVHPGVGGVLVRGEKGTAKSTAVRALAALLPDVRVVAGCRFSCDPAGPDPSCPDGPHRFDVPPAQATVRPARLVELPVGATEDRLAGSLDLQRALADGVRAYQPGLLAEAHRGVLYVDEVNLLHDHLVDLLLDAAAMGRNHVERDGVSLSHASRFLLVGSMNPEEGELRPQLLDRFGLAVDVRASREVDIRVDVVRRRLAFEDDPAGFASAWAGAERDTAARIVAAQARLASVVLPEAELRRIAAVCAAFDVDGMRADLVIARAAVAHAAWRGGDVVTEEDVRVAARLALPHRRRRDPFDEPGMDDGALDDAMREAAGQINGPDDEPPPPDPDGNGPGGGPSGDTGPQADGPGAGGSDTTAQPERAGERPAHAGSGPPEGRVAPPPGAVFRARTLTVPGIGEGAPGRRSRARTDGGRVVRASEATPLRAADIHLPATITAAAPHQRARGRSGSPLLLRHDDLRRSVREGREGNLVLFAVDASGSMAARTRMAAVTGAVLSLLRDAYQRRDKVGMISFRAGGAELVLPPTSSVPAAQARLTALRTGGRTPLAEGLLRARKVLAVERLRDPRRRALLVLLTDGRATVGVSGDPVHDACRAAVLLAADCVATVVVDCEGGPVRLGLAARIAVAAGGELMTIGELSADGVAGVVRSARAA